MLSWNMQGDNLMGETRRHKGRPIKRRPNSNAPKKPRRRNIPKKPSGLKTIMSIQPQSKAECYANYLIANAGNTAGDEWNRMNAEKFKQQLDSGYFAQVRERLKGSHA